MEKYQANLSAMLLSGNQIQTAVHSKAIGIEPFTEGNLKGASYTFTLGTILRTFKKAPFLRTDRAAEYEEIELTPEGYCLQPGEFVVGFTKEKLTLNGAYACLLSARGSCAQIGLNVLLSDTFAEPDTDGTLALAISNAASSPIQIFESMKIVKGLFMKVIA